MASGFTFGFQTDDIEVDIDDDVPAVEEHGPGACQMQGDQNKEKVTLLETKRHGIDELVRLCHAMCRKLGRGLCGFLEVLSIPGV